MDGASTSSRPSVSGVSSSSHSSNRDDCRPQNNDDSSSESEMDEPSESDFSMDDPYSEDSPSSMYEFSPESDFDDSSSESEQSTVYFRDIFSFPDLTDNLNVMNPSMGVFSSFFLRKPTDCVCARAPAPEGDYLWEVSLYPFSQVSYVSRDDRWRHAQVIFTRTLNKTDDLFQEVMNVMDETYKYVSVHPNCQNGPYDRRYSQKLNVKSFIDMWDGTTDHGVNSNYFWRKEKGCIWLRAPAPLGDLLLEMSLYDYKNVAGVRRENRWRFARMNLSHTINTTDSVYNKLVPVIKDVYSQICSHPDKIASLCRDIEDILL